MSGILFLSRSKSRYLREFLWCSFGDVQTRDRGVFPLVPPPAVPHGFREVFEAYNKVTPHVQLSGPTNFAPLIHKALELVRQTRAVCLSQSSS